MDEVGEGKPWRPSLPQNGRDLLEQVGESGPGRLDRDGEPMGVADWMEALDDPDYRVLARDQVGDQVVATVWLGVPDGDPLSPSIFGSLVMGDDADERMEMNLAIWRQFSARLRHSAAEHALDPSGTLQSCYATEAEALTGHREVVAAVRAGLVTARPQDRR